MSTQIDNQGYKSNSRKDHPTPNPDMDNRYLIKKSQDTTHAMPTHPDNHNPTYSHQKNGNLINRTDNIC